MSHKHQMDEPSWNKSSKSRKSTRSHAIPSDETWALSQWKQQSSREEPFNQDRATAANSNQHTRSQDPPKWARNATEVTLTTQIKGIERQANGCNKNGTAGYRSGMDSMTTSDMSSRSGRAETMRKDSAKARKQLQDLKHVGAQFKGQTGEGHVVYHCTESRAAECYGASSRL